MKNSTRLQVMLVAWFSFWSASSMAGEHPAVLDWYQRTELSTPVTGIIKQVHVDVGDQVTSGQVLITLDDRGLLATIKKAKGVLVRATETYTEAKREKERAKELFDRSAISVHDRQLVNIEFSNADAQLREAQAGLELAKLDLEYSIIRSPYDGVVVQRYAGSGQTVVSRSKADTLMIVADNTRMAARSQLGADEFQGMAIGKPLSVKVSGKVYAGKIVRLGQETSGQPQELLYIMDVVFEAVPGSLRKGQPALIRLP